MKNERGVTLVALVITIIILVILAAVSVASITKSGIITYAKEGTYQTGMEQFTEGAKIDVAAKQMEKQGDLTESDLREVLEKHGTISNNGEKSILDEKLTSKDNKYEVTIRDIWNGGLTEQKNIINFTITWAVRHRKFYL